MKKLLITSLIMSLFISFASFAFPREGMCVVSPNDETEACYKYLYDDGLYGSYLINEWKQVWDNWYYFGDDGRSKQNTWAEIDGKWYYFNEWSVMLSDTTTPDGYYVGSDGAWVENDDGETATNDTGQILVE